MNFAGQKWKKTYNYTELAVELNELEEGVAPTDSRLRPDQRLMEEGQWDEANKVKVMLEEKQRAARRRLEKEAQEAAQLGRTGSRHLQNLKPCTTRKGESSTGVNHMVISSHCLQVSSLKGISHGGSRRRQTHRLATSFTCSQMSTGTAKPNRTGHAVQISMYDRMSSTCSESKSMSISGGIHRKSKSAFHGQWSTVVVFTEEVSGLHFVQGLFFNCTLAG